MNHLQLVLIATLLTITISECKIVTQSDLNPANARVESLNFESWLPCNTTDLHLNAHVKSSLRCPPGDNTYHRYTMKIGWGTTDGDSGGSYSDHVIPLNVASSSRGVSALKSPSECINRADGDCLLLNQGEAELKVRLSPLMTEKVLSMTPVIEFPYDYDVETVVFNTVEELFDWGDTRNEGIDFPCPEPLDPLLENGTFYYTGERCEPITCSCGDTESTGGTYEKTAFIALSASTPSCGLFSVEDAHGFGVFSGEMTVTYGNEDGSRTYSHPVRFTSRGQKDTFNRAAAEGVVQVTIDKTEDVTRHSKKPEILPGHVVICNWDGANLWDGPDLGDENPVFSNTFLIPYTGLDVESVDGPPEWTMAAWYYVGDHAADLEYGATRGFPTNGIGMQNLRRNIERFSEGNLTVFNGPSSECCNRINSAETDSDSVEYELKEWVSNFVLTMNTPKDILEWNGGNGYNMLSETEKERVKAPARTRYRCRTPGFFSEAEDPETIGRKLIENSFLFDYELFGDDFRLNIGSEYDELSGILPDTTHHPFRYSLRTLHLSDSENLPFATTGLRPGTDTTMVTTRVNVLISTMILTGRHLNNETIIPSTFARLDPKTDQAERLYCHASQFANSIEIGGVICNSGRTEDLTPENLRGYITCKVGAGVALSLEGTGNEGNPTEFIHAMEGVITGNVRGRLCTNFTYLMNPTINAPFPLNNTASFYALGQSTLLPPGSCTLVFTYLTPLNPTNVRFKGRNASSVKEIVIGRYENILCEDLDQLAFQSNIDSGIDDLNQVFYQYGTFTPSDCSGSQWDFKCFFAGREQEDDPIGGVVLTIVLGSLAAGLLTIATLAIFANLWYRKKAKSQIVSIRSTPGGYVK